MDSKNKTLSLKLVRAALKKFYFSDADGFIRFAENLCDTNGRPFIFNWHQKKVSKDLTDHNKKMIFLIVPRGYGKSEMIQTFGAWLIGGYPEVTILYTTAEGKKAERCINRIQNIITSKKFEKYFGDYKGNPEADNRPWNKSSFTVKRKSTDADKPTIRAQVVTGRGVTGSRTHVQICDDITSHANTRTKAGRDQIIEAYHSGLWPAVINDSSPDVPFFARRIYLATPYAIGDCTHDLLTRIGEGKYDALNPVVFQESVFDDEGNIKFPHIDRTTVDAFMENYPDLFDMNYRCSYEVLQGQRIIQQEWIQRIADIPEDDFKKGAWFVTTDAAFSKSTRANKTVYTLMLFVPGKTRQERKYYFVYSTWGKFSAEEAPTKFSEFLGHIRKEYGVVKTPVFFEYNGPQQAFWDLLSASEEVKGLVGQWIKRNRADDNRRFGEGKIARGTVASHTFKDRQVYFLSKGIMTAMVSELTAVTTTHKDGDDDFYDTVIDGVNYAPLYAKAKTEVSNQRMTYRWK